MAKPKRALQKIPKFKCEEAEREFSETPLIVVQG